VHLGHGNVASVLGAWLGVCRGGSPHASDCGRGITGRLRTGIGVRRDIGEEDDCLFVVFNIEALRTCARAGLIPQSKHGGNGVRSLAVFGSKFDGTGLEWLQIVQIQVALLVGGGSGVGRWKGLSALARGVEVALRECVLRSDMALFCIEDRFEGFGTSVILAEDLRKPAWEPLTTFQEIFRKCIHKTRNDPHPSNL
jgi:hypothetical protein